MSDLIPDRESGDKKISGRLELATPVELNRMRDHLSLSQEADVDQIARAYLDAADNTILNIIRPLVNSEVPTYRQILLVIAKELRSFNEGASEFWQAVRSLKVWSYKSALEDLSDDELESRIFEICAAEYFAAKEKLIADPGFWTKLGAYLPGMTGAAASTAAAVSAATATRLPFAAAAPGAVAGPVGLGLAVLMMGVQASGPAFRKIVPATVELILIHRRISFMPEE